MTRKMVQIISREIKVKIRVTKTNTITNQSMIVFALVLVNKDQLIGL